MANLDQESLFSLELIVDQLSLCRSVECRIPAVAFRLLDFPTMLIYHVEPELASTIRSKLLEDRCRSVPAQFNELKDRRTGAFSIRRGKSCLFRVSPNTLVSSLSGAPLYVMVVDMFPEMPKLVGSCGVPLNVCARDLYSSVVTNGISVPAVQAEKRELDLCNLMGTKLGTILLGYRLLSLGAALLSHIPTHDVIHIKPKDEICQHCYPMIEEVLQSIAFTTAKQTTNAETRSDSAEVDKILEKTFADSQTQIDARSFGSVGTQTLKPKSPAVGPRTSLAHDAADAITTNIVCPPPLFYNSTTCKKTICWYQEDWLSVWQAANDGSNWSDDGTIRVEDKYLDADEEAAHNVNFSPTVAKDVSSPHAYSKNVLRSDLTTRTPYQPGNMTEFPILSALMAEILRFQGMDLVPDSSGGNVNDKARYKIQKTKLESKLEKGDHERAVEPKRLVHKCEHMLPCGKGLLISKRRSSVPARHQRPFFAGLTKTQRLRLAKVNPKLLREIEAKEVQRRSELGAARVSGMRQKENVPTKSQQKADEIDTLKRIDISGAVKYVDESRESTARYKCPVPTPRTSKMSLPERQLAEKNGPNVDTSYFGTKTYTVGCKRMERQLLQQSSSEENLELTLPAMQGDSETDYGMHHYQGQSAMTDAAADSNLAGRHDAAHPKKLTASSSDDLDAEPANNFRQTTSASAPMANRDASAGGAQLETTSAAAVLSVEDLGLRKVVDRYSSDSDDDSRTDATNNDESKNVDTERNSVEESEEEFGPQLFENAGKGAEPELQRKVVNEYSEQSDVSEDAQSDLDYEYDFEDTPARSLKTMSTINSAVSSIADNAMHRRMVSPIGSEEVGNSRLPGIMGEQCKDIFYIFNRKFRLDIIYLYAKFNDSSF